MNLSLQNKITYNFKGEIWQHASPSGWYFICLPKKISKEIRENLSWQEEGWGRMKAIAVINSLKWDTAIWFDTKQDTYVLPIKAEIRKKLSLTNGITVEASIFI